MTRDMILQWLRGDLCISTDTSCSTAAFLPLWQPFPMNAQLTEIMRLITNRSAQG